LTSQGEVARAVLVALRDAGDHGLIVDESRIMVERALDRDFDRSTIAARFTELKARGMIRETDERRQTPRGRKAAVFKILQSGRDALQLNLFN